jgi:hypothetical protein
MERGMAEAELREKQVRRMNNPMPMRKAMKTQL